MNVIRAVADRVAVLDHGQIVESGEVIDVFLSPAHPTTRVLLAEIGMETPGDRDRGGFEQDRRDEVIDGGSRSRTWRLTYRGDVVATPVLTATARECGLDIAILDGTIGRIKEMPFAILKVRITNADAKRLTRFSETLAQRAVHFEPLS
jgi:D-methionine transport system ATP-binding protein